MAGKTAARHAPLGEGRKSKPNDHQRNCGDALHEHILRLYTLKDGLPLVVIRTFVAP